LGLLFHEPQVRDVIGVSSSQGCDLAQRSQGAFVNFDQRSFDARISAGVGAMGYVTPTPIQQQAIPVVL
jgi:superfamily II DNA/RNA helicase